MIGKSDLLCVMMVNMVLMFVMIVSMVLVLVMNVNNACYVFCLLSYCSDACYARLLRSYDESTLMTNIPFTEVMRSAITYCIHNARWPQ